MAGPRTSDKFTVMSDRSMLQSYLPILIQGVLVVAVGSAILGVSRLIGVKRPTREKLSPYECGIAPVGDARERFSVSFYLVGMLFILFDVEAVFLYPWAVVYKSLKWFGFVEMFLFIAILMAGYLYLWKKGALDWSR
jgi:NADH-quinone oxidoreductase subunit A